MVTVAATIGREITPPICNRINSQSGTGNDEDISNSMQRKVFRALVWRGS